MHELKEKAKKICELKDKILEWTKNKLDEDCIDIEAAGQTIDMVKDLADAEKNLYKAAYYCSIVEAMKEEKEMEEMELKMGVENGRMGYDHWRTSSGRYAPKGTGHWTQIHGGGRRSAGYTPTPYYDPMIVDGEWPPDMMGYDGRNGGRSMSQGGREMGSRTGGTESTGGRMGYSDPDMERFLHDERHGEPFRRWQLARKHYTETRSEGDKQEMTEHAKEHMVDTCMTLKDIWQDATPELRDRMKKDLTALMAEMK